MKPRSWTYQELTLAAIEDIERCAEQAELLSNEGRHEIAGRYGDRAYGIYTLWNRQTQEHQSTEDRDRLLHLVIIVGHISTGEQRSSLAALCELAEQAQHLSMGYEHGTG